MSRHAEHSDSEENGNSSDRNNLPATYQSPKLRSLSDAAKHGIPQAPAFRDLLPSTKDDISLTNSSPKTPQKPPTLQPPIHDLSLQVPRQAATTPGALAAVNRAPLSPKLDPAQTYGSPASVIPRRSRGLDFSRACTNLHHSTLAESSPESSPNVSGRGINIPQRRGGSSFAVGSPGTGFGQQVGSVPGDRTAMSSSVSSVNMMESDTSSSEDDDDEPMNPDRDEIMITTTPHASKCLGFRLRGDRQSVLVPANYNNGAYQ